MIRVLPLAERNVQIDPPLVITVPAATATIIFSDISKERGEISQRFLQNISGGDLYYSEGVLTAAGAASCDNLLNYHGVIPSGQQLDCSGHRRCVCVYSAGGASVATTIRRRITSSHHN